MPAPRSPDEEIARILTEQEQRATDLLIKHRRGLELVAEALLEHETIDGSQVARLIQQGLTESGDSDSIEMNVTTAFEPDGDETVIAPEPAPAPAPSALRDAPRIVPRPAAGT